MVLFRALGATAVQTSEGIAPLGGMRPRRLLAALLLHPGTPVPVDELVDQVWPDVAPRTARKTLQTYILALRRHLGEDRILTLAPGYALRVEPDEFDVSLFAAGVAHGRAAFTAGDWAAACESLRDALSLWRGAPFSDLAVRPPLAYELEELRGYAVLDLARAEISAGRLREAIARLRGELAAAPLREELWTLLMAALERDGRSSEALSTFEQARALLRDELGVNPGSELRAMHAALLAGDAEEAAAAVADAPERPALDVRYARSEGGLVSFQVLGEGEQALLIVPDWFNSITVLQEHPIPRQLLARLARGRRVILFDTIGMGRSDPLALDVRPTVEGWMRDALAVLRAVGVDRCVVLGSSAGAAVAIKLAVDHPELIDALVLHNPVVRFSDTNLARVGHEEVLRLFQEKWATGTAIPSVAASRANDADFNAWFGRFMGSAVSAERVPGLLEALVFSLDVLSDVPRLRCPVLITVRSANPILGTEPVAALQAALLRATYRTLEGGDHLWFIDDAGDLAAAVNEFLSAADPSRAS